MLSTRAGGLGINLATADTVVLFDSDYNPHNDIQAQARAHRLGQRNPVMIYRLITRLTIEERMMQLAKEKLVLEQIVVRKLGHRELKQAELDGILKYGAAELFADERLTEGLGNEKHHLGGKVADQERERVMQFSSTSKIVYDEEALEKLLDRTNMETEEQDQMEVVNGELMAGFKIANFDIVHHSQTKEESWEELLKGRVNALKSVKEKEKSSGGRRRRKAEMNYKIDDDLSNGSPDSDFDADQHAQDEEEDETSSSNFDQETNLGHNDNASMLTPKPLKRKEQCDQHAVPAPAKKRQVHEPPPPPPPEPCITWRGTELQVLGLGKRERQLFLKLLLRFGFPDEDHGSWEEFKSRLPRKKHQSIDEYAKMLITAASGAPPDGASKEDFIFDCKPEELMARIGMMHLFKERLRAIQIRPGKLFMNPESCKQLYPNGIWKDHHDQALLRNLIRCGYGRWKDILCNGNDNLEEILCRELKVELPKPSKAPNEVIEIDNSTSSEGEHGDQESRPKRTKSETTKKKSMEDPASVKTKIRSAEVKCRNWVATRLKDLAAALTEDKTQDSTQPKDTSKLQSLSEDCPAKKLRGAYQRIINQCTSVRENSNLLYGSRTYAEILAAGARFRDQLSQLEGMAQELATYLPDTYNQFLGKAELPKESEKFDSTSPSEPPKAEIKP